MKITSVFFSLFLFLLLSISVSAIGISPPSYKLDVSAGEEQSLDFFIKNNAGKAQDVSVFIKGDLNEYVTLSEKKFTIPEQAHSMFTVDLRFPDSFEGLSPGKHELLVFVQEKNPVSAGISATTGVIGKIIVFIPYPGRYAEIYSFSAGGANAGENTPVSFSIINRGGELLDNTRAVIELQEQNNQILQTITYENIDIPTDKIYSEEFFFNTSELPAYSYKAKLTFYYDDIVLIKERDFLLGYFNVTLAGYQKKLEKRGIIPFRFDIRSLWKGNIYVSAEVILDGTKSGKTSQELLKDFGTIKMTSYIDTTKLTLGPHTGTIIVSIKREEAGGADPLIQSFPITFDLVEETAASAEPTVERPLMKTTTLLLIVMALLLLAALGVLGFLMVNNKKDGKKKWSKE